MGVNIESCCQCYDLYFNQAPHVTGPVVFELPQRIFSPLQVRGDLSVSVVLTAFCKCRTASCCRAACCVSACFCSIKLSTWSSWTTACVSSALTWVSLCATCSSMGLPETAGPVHEWSGDDCTKTLFPSCRLLRCGSCANSLTHNLSTTLAVRVAVSLLSSTFLSQSPRNCQRSCRLATVNYRGLRYVLRYHACVIGSYAHMLCYNVAACEQ